MKDLLHAGTPLRGAILFMGKYGATRQYADWIGEATNLPVFDLDREQPDLADLDFLILGSSVYLSKLYLRHWLRDNWPAIKDKAVMLFSVSGSAADHPDLEAALNASLTPEMRQTMEYVPLRGRLDHQQLPWWLRPVLKLAGRMQKDEETRDRMIHGFDKMDKNKIGPIVTWAEEQVGVLAG